jgi:hypothetical protein
MEATTLEPETPVVAAPVIETAVKEAQAPKAPLSTAEVDAMVGNLLKPVVIKNSLRPTKPTHPEKQPDKKPEDDKETNFANLRKKVEEYEKTTKEKEAEITKIRDEYENFKKNPVPKEFHEKLTAAEKKAQEADDRLALVSLRESPSFQAKFEPGIQSAAKVMIAELKKLEIDQSEITAALSKWDEAQFDDWASSMSSTASKRFLDAYGEAVRLDAKRTEELSKPNETKSAMDAQLAESREGEAKRHFNSLKADRDNVFNELDSTHKDVMADADIRKATQAALDRAIGADGGNGLTQREILSNVAHTHLLAHHFKKVDTERAKLAEENAALKAKLEERDSFIKGVNGSIPVPSGSASSQSSADVDSIVAKLLKPSVRA